MTLYPKTKASPNRAIDMLEMHGSERIIVASACDWGPSDPVAVPNFVLEMRRRGHDEALIDKVVLHNPAAFLGQSPKFRLKVPQPEMPQAGEPLNSHA
jgi:predicted metal-dependent TIM-barrel fold hydrolase